MTDELKDIYVNSSTNLILYDTIELKHPSFTQDWHLVKSKTEFQGKLENNTLVTYIPCSFDFKLPDSSDKGLSNLQVSLDATDPTILQNFWAYMDDDTATPIEFNWRLYINNSTEIQNSILGYKLYSVTLDYNQVNLVSTAPDIVNRPFPYDRYDLTRFKGLKYV